MMSGWNCSDHLNSPLSVVSASEHVCVPPSMCGAAMHPHRCVVPPAWTMDDVALSRPCPQVASFCPQKPIKVHAAPYMDASDAGYCRAPRFSTSVAVDTSPCHNSATNQEPCYNSGTSCSPHAETRNCQIRNEVILHHKRSD